MKTTIDYLGLLKSKTKIFFKGLALDTVKPIDRVITLSTFLFCVGQMKNKPAEKFDLLKGLNNKVANLTIICNLATQKDLLRIEGRYFVAIRAIISDLKFLLSTYEPEIIDGFEKLVEKQEGKKIELLSDLIDELGLDRDLVFKCLGYIFMAMPFDDKDYKILLCWEEIALDRLFPELEN